MRLWTIQPVEIYEQIKRDGRYTFDYEKSDNARDFAKQYKWLEHEMFARGIEKSHPDDSLVWAWYIYGGRRHKPDLRHSAYDARGTKSVCMEIEIPDSQVLLSDFGSWHYVLNNWYLGNSENESEWEKEQEWLDSLLPGERQKQIESSWQKVFDIAPYTSNWRSNGQYVQATFYNLFLDDIKKVQHFTCR